jgi:predicted small secreted protein
MTMRKLRATVGTMLCVVAFTLAGCHTAQPTGDGKAGADVMEEARQVAETSLGKQAEILVVGNLAANGREQLLAVNRISKEVAANARGGNPAPVFITRAAILEKDGGKWSEILRCDEHLKNPNGYLGGSSAARFSGWRLEYSQDAKEGFEMKFTPAESAGQASAGFDVRWNKNTKRYQSFDQSHERYLNEIPVLETPQSILR